MNEKLMRIYDSVYDFLEERYDSFPVPIRESKLDEEFKEVTEKISGMGLDITATCIEDAVSRIFEASLEIERRNFEFIVVWRPCGYRELEKQLVRHGRWDTCETFDLNAK